jgi:hypothetical protein
MSSMAGELITERLEYDGGRQVTVYVPPAPAEAVVFAGDGQLISQWSQSLEAADVPSTMIVGVHRLSEETTGAPADGGVGVWTISRRALARRPSRSCWPAKARRDD